MREIKSFFGVEGVTRGGRVWRAGHQDEIKWIFKKTINLSGIYQEEPCILPHNLKPHNLKNRLYVNHSLKTSTYCNPNPEGVKYLTLNNQFGRRFSVVFLI